MDSPDNSKEPVGSRVTLNSPEQASWSVDDLPSVPDLPALGLVGPGLYAGQGEVEAVRKAGVGVCRRTGVLVCLVGSPRLASRPGKVPEGPKAVASGLSKRIWRQTGMKVSRKEAKDAEVKALAISSRLPEEVKNEQLALLLSETGPTEGGNEQAEVAPLAWAEPAEMRFPCRICPSTAASKKALLKHEQKFHRGVQGSDAAGVQERPLQAAFFGSSTGYIKVKTAVEAVQNSPFVHGLSVEQYDIVNRLTNASNAECSDEASHNRESENHQGTGFLFRTDILKANKKLGLEPDTAYGAAIATSSQYQEDGVSLSPMYLLEETIVEACTQSFAKFQGAPADLKAACIWKAQGGASDAAAEAARAKANVSGETKTRYANVVKRLVAFVARMIMRMDDGALAPEVYEACWREDHNTVLVAVGTLFSKCQEQSLALVSGIQPVDVMDSAHEVLFELLVRPIPLARQTDSVSPVFAFLAASATRKKAEARTASGSGSSEYEWNPNSSGVTPLTAAIIKVATAVSVRHVTVPGLSRAERKERVNQVRRLRQEPHLDAATAPVSEVAAVLRTGRIVLAAEHSGAKVLPCPNSAHPLCAFIGRDEVQINHIGRTADEAAKRFWTSFHDMFDASQGADLPLGLDQTWIAIPASGVDPLHEEYKSWMVSMGSEQEEIARSARDWVTTWAVPELDVAEVAEDGGAVVVRNKKALVRVRSALTGCVRALMVMCTLGTGAPLRATETSSINLRGREGVLRDLYFLDGAFFIIHHRTKASHNVATSGEAQPRRLPVSASAALAAWCRVGLPMRDLLLHCGESIFGYSPAPSSAGPAASISGLFWASNSPSSSCANRINDGLADCGLPLTISQYRQYSAFMLRAVTEAGGGADEDDENAGIAILAAAAERQFGHSERIGADFYGRTPRLAKLVKELPKYAAVSAIWHTATGQGSVVVAQVQTGDQPGSSSCAAAGPASPSVAILPSKRRAAEGNPSGEVAGIEPRRRLTVARVSEPFIPSTPASIQPQFAQLVNPSPLLLRTAAAAVVGVSFHDFSWATKEQKKAAQYCADGMPAGDALLVLPTGGGKFLTYAASCITDHARLTVVIVPFVALAQDLLRRFVKSGLNVVRFGDLTSTTNVLAGCPGVHVVIAGLESVLSDTWTPLFSGAHACSRRTFIVIEECHVLYYDRYRDLGGFAGAVRRFVKANLCPAPPMLLVTATAPPQCATDIISACGSDVHKAPTQFRSPCTIRRNVRLSVTTASPELTLGGPELKLWITEQVLYTLQKRRANEQHSSAGVAADRRYVVLVFVETRDMTTKVAACLQDRFAEVLSYHAKLSDADKKAVVDKLIRSPTSGAVVESVQSRDGARLSNVTAVVATVAFGVGLDIHDVCTVCIVGHRAASSLITYAQMAGRAGRDGLPSLCATLLHNEAPNTSFTAFWAGSSGYRGLRDGASPSIATTGGADPTGDFAEYCLDRHTCRQGALQIFLDGARTHVGDVAFFPGDAGLTPTCASLGALFFPGKPFEACDVCAPDSMAHHAPHDAGHDGEDSLDDEPADFSTEMITQDDVDSWLTTKLPSRFARPAVALPLAAEVEIPPLPTVDDHDASRSLAELRAILNGAPPHGDLAQPRPETHALTLPSLPQVGTVPAGNLHIPSTETAVAAQVMQTAPVNLSTGIPAAIAARAEHTRDFVSMVRTQASTLRDTFPRRSSPTETCVICLSALMCGGMLSMGPSSGTSGSGTSGLTQRGRCDHRREGCLNCTQKWTHITGATGPLHEHNYKSPKCPLAAARRLTGRCNSCWMSTVFGERHKWGRDCPYGPFRNAALRMFWDSKPAVAALVAHEEARRGAVRPYSDSISTSIAKFEQFLTRDTPEHGPPLLQLIVAAHSSLN